MYRNDERAGWRRAGALASTLAVHGALAALLIWGLAIDRGAAGPERPEAVAAFDVAPPPPPPEADPDLPPDAPAPAGRTAEAAPLEAPQPALPIPVAPAPAAPDPADGNEPSAGSGASGSGPGAGGAGAGSGGGGVATPARRIAGALRDSDYPRAAEAARMGGVVGISFRVRTDGRVDRCTIVRSSGHALLDDLTCRLFTERYRFSPAMTAQGQPVESTLQTTFTWSTRRR